MLTTTARADDLVVYGAGSLCEAIGQIAAEFGQAHGLPVTTQFGPSGRMRERIEKGERADLFTSADVDHVRKMWPAHRRRDAPRPAATGRYGRVPGRPLLPPARHPDRAAAVAGARVGHRAVGPALSPPCQPEGAAALARRPAIDASDLEFLRQADGAKALDGAAGTDLTMPEAAAELEREMIRRALAESGGSRADAARRLGINMRTPGNGWAPWPPR